MCRFAIILTITACLGIISTEGLSEKKKKHEPICAGCLRRNPTDRIYMDGLKAAIAIEHLNIKPARITEVWIKIVDGVKIIVNFETANGRSCHGSWVQQIVESKDPIRININCDVNKKE